MVHLGEVSPPVWDSIVEELQSRLDDFEESDLHETIAENWRKHANRRKFDRELFERYGLLKDIILHPRFQSVKHFLEEHSTFDFLVGDPILPVSTAVILLFMLHKRVKNDVLVLAGLFIFNINPFYVCLISFLVWLFTSRSKPKQHKRIQGTTTTTSLATTTDASKAVQLNADNAPKNQKDLEYDHVLVGNDIGTLYTAALLSKNGHRCCVLQPARSAITEVCPEGAPCAAPLLNVSVGKIERYQSLLDVVLPSASSERVRFAPVGGEDDGYTSALVRTIHSASNIHLSSLSSKASTKRGSLCTYLRVGDQSLAHDLCSSLPIDKSALVAQLDRFRGTVRQLTSYLISRVVPWSIVEPSALRKSDGFKEFVDLSSTPLEQLLHGGNGLDHSELRDVLSSIACIGAEEALPGSDCSGYMLAHALTSSAEGSFYPAGGSAAIEQSLIRAVHRSGGMVYSHVDLKEIVLEEVGSSGAGIRSVGLSVSVSNEEVVFRGTMSVVSGLGILPTITKLLPPEAVSLSMQQTLARLQASRPKLSVVYWLRGGTEELSIRSTDYYELGTFRDDVADVLSEKERLADLYVHVWSPSAKDSAWKHKDVQIVVVEFLLSASAVGSKDFLFATSRDASANSNGKELDQAPAVDGPTVFFSGHRADTHTDPGNSEYCNSFDGSITMSKSKRDRFQQRADGVLRAVYPAITEDRVQLVHVCPSMLSPYLACTPAKFGSKISSTTDIANFFLTGRDLATAGLAGDLQGGWVAANAILGYSLSDMLTSRNVVSDLAKL